MKIPTIVVGASHKRERYSYMAMEMLKSYEHPVVGVHPKLTEVSGVKVFPSVLLASEALGDVHTITMYIGAARSSGLLDEIVKVKPKRVIFNPGAENPQLQSSLEKNEIEVMEACTLVLLRSGQY